MNRLPDSSGPLQLPGYRCANDLDPVALVTCACGTSFITHETAETDAVFVCPNCCHAALVDWRDAQAADGLTDDERARHAVVREVDRFYEHTLRLDWNGLHPAERDVLRQAGWGRLRALRNVLRRLTPEERRDGPWTELLRKACAAAGVPFRGPSAQPAKRGSTSKYGSRIMADKTAEARKLLADGWSLREAATHLGIPPSTLHGWVKQP
jgi:hypothetical protein